MASSRDKVIRAFKAIGNFQASSQWWHCFPFSKRGAPLHSRLMYLTCWRGISENSFQRYFIPELQANIDIKVSGVSSWGVKDLYKVLYCSWKTLLILFYWSSLVLLLRQECGWSWRSVRTLSRWQNTHSREVSTPSFLFLWAEQFAKQTRFNDSKLNLHIVQWYFATLITLSNVIGKGNYHIKSPSYVTWRHKLLNYLRKQTNKIPEAQEQHHHKPVSFSSKRRPFFAREGRTFANLSQHLLWVMVKAPPSPQRGVCPGAGHPVPLAAGLQPACCLSRGKLKKQRSSVREGGPSCVTSDPLGELMFWLLL